MSAVVRPVGRLRGNVLYEIARPVFRIQYSFDERNPQSISFVGVRHYSS
jgi:hypothetical protein